MGNGKWRKRANRQHLGNQYQIKCSVRQSPAIAIAVNVELLISRKMTCGGVSGCTVIDGIGPEVGADTFGAPVNLVANFATS
jgi:hypothetical protein